MEKLVVGWAVGWLRSTTTTGACQWAGVERWWIDDVVKIMNDHTALTSHLRRKTSILLSRVAGKLGQIGARPVAEERDGQWWYGYQNLPADILYIVPVHSYQIMTRRKRGYSYRNTYWFTVEPVITHTPRWMAEAMGYYGSWLSRGGLKIDLKAIAKFLGWNELIYVP